MMDWTSGEPTADRHTFQFTPPLLRASEQMDRDWSRVFCEHNSFSYQLTDGNVKPLMHWLRTGDPAHLGATRELILILEPTSFFDVQALREAFSSGEVAITTDNLARAIVGAGIRTKQIRVQEPDLGFLRAEAKTMKWDSRDAKALCQAWVAELCDWLRHAEHELGSETPSMVALTDRMDETTLDDYEFISHEPDELEYVAVEREKKAARRRGLVLDHSM